MQDFTTYNYNITIEQLEKSFNLVGDISVIINGEYYTLIKEAPKGETTTHNLYTTTGGAEND